jgi:hypothetical protein
MKGNLMLRWDSIIAVGVPLFFAPLCLCQAAAEQKKASNGAIVEAVFILQNKNMKLTQRVIALDQALQAAKDNSNKLSQETIELESKLKAKREHFTELIIQRSMGIKLDTLDKSIALEREVGHLVKEKAKNGLAIRHDQFIQMFYPEYKKRLEQFIETISNHVKQFPLDSDMDDEKIRKEVKRADIIKDIVDAQEEILGLIFDIDQRKLELEHSHLLVNALKKTVTSLERLVKSNGEKEMIGKIRRLKKELTLMTEVRRNVNQALIAQHQMLKNTKIHLGRLNHTLNTLDEFHTKERAWFITRLEQLINQSKG